MCSSDLTCPVDAIAFGNLLDKESAVVKAKARAQDYAVLGYLNIRPGTTYSGKLRNPNPKMPDYRPFPLSRVEYDRKNVPPSHGDGHGHGGAHGEAKPGSKATGHGALDAVSKFGGLS